MSQREHAVFWRLIGGAAIKPLNLAALVAMLIAAVVLQPWIVAAAVPIYVVLVASTVRDPDEAQRLLGLDDPPKQLTASTDLTGLSDDLRVRVEAVLREEQAILLELDTLPFVPDGAREQVVALAGDLVETARRASDVDRYLATVDADALRAREADYRARAETSDRAAAAAEACAEQLEVVEGLTARREALEVEIGRVETGLGAIRARIVQARADSAAPRGVAGDVTELRERVRVLAESLGEAYRASEPERPSKGA